LVGDYTVYVDDVSWQQAADKALQMGGHLLTINSQEEFDAVCAVLDSIPSIQFAWLGASRDASGKWMSVTGEEITFFKWDVGEPSGTDRDGTAENYLMLWKISHPGYTGEWRYNDTRDNPVALRPAAYSGKIAFLITFD